MMLLEYVLKQLLLILCVDIDDYRIKDAENSDTKDLDSVLN